MKTLLINGRPFFWLADTWWYGATKRMPFAVFKELVHKRKKQGFTAIQFVVGVPPEIDIFDKNAAGDGGMPFHADKSINNTYFEGLDKRIIYLVEQKMIPCIVGGWGWHMDVMGERTIKRFWTEIVRRYAKYPVVFCLTGEIDGPMPISSFMKTIFHILPWSLQRLIYQLQKRTLGNRIKKWQNIAHMIKQIDPYHRPLATHTSSYKNAASILSQKGLLDFDTIQSGHSKDGYKHMVDMIYKRKNRNIPIINMEPWYEGILGNFDAYYQRQAFWISMLGGAGGHSYGAHGVWQMAGKNDRFMDHWGTSYWKDAIKYSGAEQIGKAKRFLETMEWWKLETDAAIFLYDNDIFCARLGDTRLAYIPKVTKTALYIENGNKIRDFRAYFFDPETMKNVGNTQSKKHAISLPGNSVGKDLIVVCKHKT